MARIKKNSKKKLESDLKIAKVEVKRTMGVHARNKAALMAATEPGAPLEAYHQSEVSRKALTKAQKVYARIVKLLIERAKANRRHASWVHKRSGDAAFAARHAQPYDDSRVQLCDDRTVLAGKALIEAHQNVKKLEGGLTLLNVKNILMKLSDIFLTLANLVARHGPNFNQNRVSRLKLNVYRILKALKLELAKIPFDFNTIAPGQMFPAYFEDHDARQHFYLALCSYWARIAEEDAMPWK